MITTNLKDKVLRIGIQRPERKNALTPDMYEAMAQALETADDDPMVRVVVIHGTPDCFTSGNDLNDFVQAPPGGETAAFRLMNALNQTKKPLLAAVNGPAVGIGTTMLLHCDVIYAGTGATFLLPFVNLAICPEAACTLLLPRLVGYQRAAELLFLGEPLTATRAYEIGMVNRLFPDVEVLDNALKLARNLAEKPPASLRTIKALLKEVGTNTAERMETELSLFLDMLPSPEAREAFSAFLERRSPDFSQFV
jgi:enoyl-CoA hydratase/carnithine racemase